jgi:hypothetical protein
VYYDGWVAQDIRRILCTDPCRWDEPVVNMLAVDWPGGSYGILGAKLSGIGRDELVAIARTLPGPQ